MRRRQVILRLLLAGVTLASGLAAVTAAPSDAAFPGANGPIVYVCSPPGSNGDLCRLHPTTLSVTVLVDGFLPVHPERRGVSPDGSLVAYSQVVGIWVRRLNPASTPVSGHIGCCGDGDVSFTRDGTSIVYRCSFGLCRTPVSGGNRTPLPGTVPGDTEPEVTPEGSRIAFVNGGTLFTMPLGGGMRTPLTSGIALDRVSWAPNGSRIAFVATESLCPVPGVATIPAGGGAVTCLPNGGGAVHPSFSPDGSQIFAASNGHAAFLGANGAGRREVPSVTGVEDNNWAPRPAGGPRCTALNQQLTRTSDPRARQIIQVFLTASRCAG